MACCAVAAGAVVFILYRGRPAPTPGSISSIQSEAERLTSPPPPKRKAPRPVPQWIWSTPTPADGEKVLFAKDFRVDAPPVKATLILACDNHAAVELDGQRIGSSDDWSQPLSIDMTKALTPGEHQLRVAAQNDGSAAGLVALLRIDAADGTHTTIVSDPSWNVLAADGTAHAAVAIGPVGCAPWGAIAGLVSGDIDRGIVVPEGFECELVATVPHEFGSVVSLCALADGQLLAGVQGHGLVRINPMPIGGEAESTPVTREPVDIGGLQGLLRVENTIYGCSNTNAGKGIYRLEDSNQDGTLDKATLLLSIPEQNGEHGPHGLALGPDGLIYVMVGNHTLPPKLDGGSVVPQRWGEDILLPRLWDANGHAVGIMAPGGWVCRFDREGKHCELVAIGFRNAYDIAFSPVGDLFSYDSDMEWDMGAPWYRPTRIVHVVPGGEYGWRSGSACWPSWYADSLPPTLDVGPGSPTGVLFMGDSNFPPPWRDAMFALDWTFGTIYAINLEPNGASYSAKREVFLSGKPLPLTDAVISPRDHSLYFAVGGRGAASAIYRVRWTGPAATQAPTVAHRTDAAARRVALEGLARDGAPASAIDDAWSSLGDKDRFVRFTARAAIEHQPVERWADRATKETNPTAAIEALIALARCGDAARRPAFLQALAAIDWNTLDTDQRRGLARALMLGLARLGPVTPEERIAILKAWEPRFPSDDQFLNRLTSEILVYLDSMAFVPKAIVLLESADASQESFDPKLLSRSDSYGNVILRMAAASPQREQVHMAAMLRLAKEGWTPALRERYFRWFAQARRTAGGLSFAGFLENIRKEALANVPEAMRAKLDKASSPQGELLEGDRPLPKGPGRKWTTAEVERIATTKATNRDFKHGEQMFAAAGCIDCHRFAGRGKAGGPDLTGVGNRFGPHELAQAIVEPSAVVSDQYRAMDLVLADGTTVTGRVVSELGGEVTVMENLLAPDALRTIPAADIRERRPSPVSQMLSGLADPLSEDELADLLFYLRTGGDARSGG